MTQRSPSSFSIRPFLYHARGPLLIGLCLSCLATLANFGLLFLSGWLLAGAAAAGLGGVITQNMFNMGLPAVGVRFFATVRIVARYAERLVTHDAAFRVTGQLRTHSFQTLIPRSESLATRTRSGDVLTRFVNDTEKLGQFPLDVLLPTLSATFCSTVSVGITAYFSPSAACALAGGLLIGGLLLPWMIGRLTDHLAQANTQRSTVLHNDILETIQGMADLLCCGAAPRQLARITAHQTQLNRQTFAHALRCNIIRNILPILSIVCVLSVIACAAHGLETGQLNGPELPMLGMGALASFEMIAPLMEARLAQERFRQAALRSEELCSLPVLTPPPQTTTALPSARELSFDQVSLRFHEENLLKDISFSLQPGERIAVTGSSGAGKSTLARLAVRLIDPDQGRITFGGTPLTRFTTEDLSEHIGMLTQTAHLFQGSIKRNLLMACPTATDAQIHQALVAVGLDEEINAMPNGLETLCGDHGVRLSGGQARRLSAAQILLRRPTLLVLDEPTESLPPTTGVALMEGLLTALPEASVLCITHRPEPLSFMHRILHLECGHLTEKGGDASPH
ncbi:thiol reductant ABC exporter subunit CydC [Saccharibacter sp. 17.LH.SD]|uniref:thiol reductant ABC exporter subunit CydC n=1 Tax=Saccharibacter sp. 17.LH.SD TaxID=2689393 RepID=UPI00136A9638|nr:thiol reductant ABC exporter subunit CydC [Saccharibacter sp. 17.LH.SD]MXV45037.1 thiol reductant ABC exporter subunit CydC [Saccharibacter sp. 17.LH.SD]